MECAISSFCLDFLNFAKPLSECMSVLTVAADDVVQ